MKYDVFISYSRKDTQIAERICRVLDVNGISYFIDRQGIGGGMEFPEILANAIIDSKVFLFLASENSYESKFTNSEVTFAFNEKDHCSILPYIIDSSVMPVSMRFIFSHINWRKMNEHPIETVLIQDLRKMIALSNSETSNTSPVVTPTQHRAPINNSSQHISSEKTPKHLSLVVKEKDGSLSFIDKESWDRLSDGDKLLKRQQNIGICIIHENARIIVAREEYTEPMMTKSEAEIILSCFDDFQSTLEYFWFPILDKPLYLTSTKKDSNTVWALYTEQKRIFYTTIENHYSKRCSLKVREL